MVLYYLNLLHKMNLEIYHLAMTNSSPWNFLAAISQELIAAHFRRVALTAASPFGPLTDPDTNTFRLVGPAPVSAYKMFGRTFLTTGCQTTFAAVCPDLHMD